MPNSRTPLIAVSVLAGLLLLASSASSQSEDWSSRVLDTFQSPQLVVADYPVRDKISIPGLSAVREDFSVGDVQGDADETDPALDIAYFAAFNDGTNLVLTVLYYDLISLPGADQPNSIFGYIQIDVDQDSATGVPGFFTDRGLGVDFEVSLFDLEADTVPVVPLPTGTIFPADVNLYGNGFDVKIPLGDLGMMPGQAVNVLVVTGNAGGPTDEAPQDGVLASSDNITYLQNDRFEAVVGWRDFGDDTGLARLVPARSDDSGLFYFFDKDNWEMLLKVLNGCGFNNHYWVFAAATTNVEYQLVVRDRTTGDTVDYFNPLGNDSLAITDTRAFATCP